MCNKWWNSMPIGLNGPELNGKDTSFPLSVTNKPRPAFEMCSLDRDGGAMGRGVGTTIALAWGGSTDEAATLSDFNKLPGTED